MRFLLVLLIPIKSRPQNPYTDSLKYAFKIDERLISQRTDTTICYVQRTSDNEIRICDKITICRDKNLKIIRIDKVFEDTKRFACAYISDGKFELMQWNTPADSSITESKHVLYFITNRDIQQFYHTLLQLPEISMPIIEKTRL